MRQQHAHPLMFAILLLSHLPIGYATEIPNPADPNRYLNAVRTFADNVLKYGRDTYGPKHMPLFVNGLNIRTHEENAMRGIEKWWRDKKNKCCFRHLDYGGQSDAE